MRKAVITFLTKDSKVLLIQSFYPASQTRFWQGISGYIEAGEDPVDAAVREAKEELDIQIDPSDLRYKHTFSTNQIEFHVFTTETWQGEFKIGEAGLEELRWFAFDELPFEQMHEGNRDWLPEVLAKS